MFVAACSKFWHQNCQSTWKTYHKSGEVTIKYCRSGDVQPSGVVAEVNRGDSNGIHRRNQPASLGPFQSADSHSQVFRKKNGPPGKRPLGRNNSIIPIGTIMTAIAADDLALYDRNLTIFRRKLGLSVRDAL
jgi:hypothetical protein